MPVSLVTHPDCARHLTGPGHPEQPARLAAALAGLTGDEWEAHLRRIEPEPVSSEVLSAVHGGAYVEHIRALAARGGGHLDADTTVSPSSFDAARRAAGAAVRAAQESLAGQRAFAVIRPPGHHAGPSSGMGFCIFNNVACAAEAVRSAGRRRILILDWDVHHGNGTQEVFYRRADVLVCSLHQEHWYPGTGAIEEMGEGDGAGYTVNIPLPAGTGDQGYRHVLEEVVIPLLGAFAPEVLLISAGFDAHHADPLGGMLLSASGFGALTRLVLAHHPGPVAAVLEGGYDLPALGRCVAATVAVLAGRAEPAAADPPPTGETGYAQVRTRIRDVRHVIRDFWSI